MSESVVSALPQSAFRLLLGTSALAITSMAWGQTPSTPNAESANSNPEQLQEVIVTANKVSEPVQKVAQTVNVVSAATIQDLHVQNIIELNNIVGGLSLTETSPSEQSISLRGIKMVNGTPTSNTVETYLNEVPISVVDAFGSTLDIGQVEVLKGPQGTLRGRPSPSGAMTITTQKGSFTDYDGYAELTGSDHEGRRVEAAFGGPISSTLAFRVATLFDHNGGTEVKDIANGRSNFQETEIVRGTLDWAPMDRLSVDAMLQNTQQRGDFYRQVSGTPPCAGSLPAPFQNVSSVGCGQTLTLEDKIALNTGTNPNHYYGTLGTLTARFSLTDHLDIDYVGGYNNNLYYTKLDFDFAGINLPSNDVNGGPANGLTYLDVTTRTKTYTNELRLQSNDNKIYNFTYGAFLSNQGTEGAFAFPGVIPGGPALSSGHVKDEGFFTNQRINIGEKDEVQVGVRYSSTHINTGFNYNATTGNASYQHQFTQDVMAYVSYGTAYRPGSGEAQASPVPGVIPVSFGNFGPEKSKSYEVGVKSQWFDRRVTANLAIFDQKYDGYISQQFNVACTGVPNPNGPALATVDGTLTGNQCFGTMRGNGNALSRGVELELHALLTQGWSLGAIYTWTDAHYADAKLPCNDYNGSGVVNTVGTPMVQQGQYVSECTENGPLGSLPKVSFTVNTNYDFMINGLPAYVRASSFTRSSSFFPQTGTVFPGYTTANVYCGLLSTDRKWEGSVWVKNVFDKVTQDTDGGPWNVGPYYSGLRIGTVTNDREVGLTLRRQL